MPKVVHFEIPADNPPRAIKFYEKVFGWEVEKWDGPIDYWPVKTGEDYEIGINGAIMPREFGELVRGVISVDSYDEYAAKIEREGGKMLTEKMKIPDIGYNGNFQDPEGNILGILEVIMESPRGGKKTQITVEPDKLEILITREFDAPRELVFKAFAEPELYQQWIGPRGLITTIDTFEPEDGGSWRYIQKDAEGNEFVFHGVNHEVTAPERIIGTFEWEGLPEKGHVLLQTARFEELPGNRTKLTQQSVFQTVMDRDGMMQTGMEEGVNDSYQRLDELLEKMQK
jgi:predicted enzyme related to lactoylglutathione lyase/uncharacterized protein YndB with AHSA1/START domain